MVEHGVPFCTAEQQSLEESGMCQRGPARKPLTLMEDPLQISHACQAQQASSSSSQHGSVIDLRGRYQTSHACQAQQAGAARAQGGLLNEHRRAGLAKLFHELDMHEELHAHNKAVKRITGAEVQQGHISQTGLHTRTARLYKHKRGAEVQQGCINQTGLHIRTARLYIKA
eukprot:1154969-Pelagomonas_calceolata.AAC.3